MRLTKERPFEFLPLWLVNRKKAGNGGVNKAEVGAPLFKLKRKNKAISTRNMFSELGGFLLGVQTSKTPLVYFLVVFIR